MSSGLLQVFFELENLHRTSNFNEGRSSKFRVGFPELDKHLKKARGHIGRNVVEITIKMKTIVRKPLMIKNN